MMFALVLVKMLYSARPDTVQFGLEIVLLYALFGDGELEKPNKAAGILFGWQNQKVAVEVFQH